ETLTHRNGAWQAFDAVVHLEDQRVGQLPDVVEMTLRANALLLCPARLPQGCAQPGEEGRQDDHRSEHGEPVPLHELARGVGDAFFTARNRQPRAMAID